MWKQLKLFLLVLISICALNLFAWLFVMSVDVTTIGSGRQKFSSEARLLFSFADQIYPYVDQITSVHRKVGDLFGLSKYYYTTWILTIALESSLTMVVVYGARKLLRLSRSTGT
jgi:hypothetical protein